MDHRIICKKCKYRGRTKSKSRAYAVALAHKKGQHEVRANWIT